MQPIRVSAGVYACPRCGRRFEGRVETDHSAKKAVAGHLSNCGKISSGAERVFKEGVMAGVDWADQHDPQDGHAYPTDEQVDDMWRRLGQTPRTPTDSEGES